MDDLISRQAAIDAFTGVVSLEPAQSAKKYIDDVIERIQNLPSAQPEIKPHRNYEYLSDYWCECGWHLGKKGTVKYCANCGRKAKWDE